MGFREKINKRPALTAAIAVAALAFIAVSVFTQLRGHDEPTPQFPTHSFYTTDDGATLFSDEMDKPVPFDHGGKPAVLAMVFTADEGKHQWVQYLQKYSDEAKARLEAVQTSRDAGGVDGSVIHDGLYVKKPGSGTWVKMLDPKAKEIITPVPPPGMGTETPKLVSP